jgi:NADH-quinone oxidoreductase subunit C
MQKLDELKKYFGELVSNYEFAKDEITLVVLPENLLTVSKKLRDLKKFKFQMLLDLCGVDYSQQENSVARYAVVYNLLSLTNNQRLRLKVLLDNEKPTVDSVVEVWPSANWYERETYDMYGIVFKNHPDLRRLLTDYEFVRYPLRKDF